MFEQRSHPEKVDRKEYKGKRRESICFVSGPKGSIRQFRQEYSNQSNRKNGNRKRLIERATRIYEETRCRVRVGGKRSESFSTEKRVSQRCPLSPTLFNIYIADLEEFCKRRQAGKLVVGERKIWSSSYADDRALVSDNEKEMKELMKACERYFREIKLVVNVEKTEIMRFSKGGGRGRQKKRDWQWGGKEVEEVKGKG